MDSENEQKMVGEKHKTLLQAGTTSKTPNLSFEFQDSISPG